MKLPLKEIGLFLTKTILIFIMVLIAFYITFKTDFVKKFRPLPEEITAVTKEELKMEKEREPGPLTDFQKFLSYPKIILYQDFITPRAINRETIIKLTRTLKVIKSIDDGYLHIKAGVDSPLMQLTKFDSVYFYANEGTNGGHILRNKSLTIESSNESITELLFPLNKIPLDTSLPYNENVEEKEILYLDLLKILQEPGDHFIGSFVSTLRYGILLELTIGYKGGEIKTP